MERDLLDALTRRNLSVFFQRSWPQFDPSDYQHNWYIDCIAEHLMALYEGEFNRLIINQPPRTGKTLLANVAYNAWLWIQDPTYKIIGISFAGSLANKIAYSTRSFIQTPFYKGLAPYVQLDPDYAQRVDFKTTAKGHRFSASVGGSVTGEGADMIIFDDPEDPAGAASDAERVSTAEWVDGTIYSRLNDQKKGKILLIQQRLHEKDTTGRIIEREADQWQHLVLQAEAKRPVYIESPLKRSDKTWQMKEGELLDPERFDRNVLDRLKGALGSYAYAGQYLQMPAPIGGGEFKKEFFQYFSINSADYGRGNYYITVDPSSGKSETGDYTAMCVWMLAPDNTMRIVDGIKERLNPTERVDRLFALHRTWNAKTGKPPSVGYEEAGLSTDSFYIKKKMREEDYFFGYKEIKHVKVSKESRIRRLIPFFERRQILFPEDLMKVNEKGLPSNFISSIIEDELLLFPNSAHDDFMDAMSMIFDMGYVFPRADESEYSNMKLDMLGRNDDVSIWDI